jgi:hypothetical protein
MKPILMTFVRGPMHLLQAEMLWLPEMNVMLDEREHTVHAYIRDETTYYYEPELSAKLTSVYDKVKEKFQQNKINVVGEVENKPLQ